MIFQSQFIHPFLKRMQFNFSREPLHDLLPGGAILSPVFYLLVGFAALSSTISLMEVVVAYFIDEKGWARKKATLLVGTGIFIFGIPSALSLGASEFFSGLQLLGDKSTGVFETMETGILAWSVVCLYLYCNS